MQAEAHETDQTTTGRMRPAEELLKDAAYTAVGLGVMAYKYSEPRLKRAAETACRWKSRESGPAAGDFEATVKQVGDTLAERVMPIRTWANRVAAENKAKQTS